MNKLFGLVLTFFILTMPLSASAARQVPGNVPEAVPLQPIPVDSAPNVSRNIQDSPSSQASEATQNNQPRESLEDLEPGNAASQNNEPATIAPKPGNSVPIMVGIILTVLILVGVGVWLRKKKSNGQTL